MDTLRLDVCYRPWRVGWAIRRRDMDSLRRIIRWSHTLWGGRHNPVVVVDNADQAQKIIEAFRVDLIWPVGEDEPVKTFPDRFRYLISPFYDRTLTIPDIHEHRAQLLDIHNALVSMGEDEIIKDLRDKHFKMYSWDSREFSASLHETG